MDIRSNKTKPPTGHDAVFSLNFSSAGKGPVMAGKAKKMCARSALSRGRRVAE